MTGKGKVGQEVSVAGDPASLTVDLGPRAYEILVGTGLLARLGGLLRPLLAQPRVIIVSDENVAPLYLDRVAGSLDEASIEHSQVVLPAGEGTKDFTHLRELIDGLLEARVERGTAIVALGGGVIGDIAGFAASILLRGLACIQVPTTLLAQVDSSVGGKTGINTRQGKNLVGTFHQPRLVVADIATLETLPERELLAGYAEVVKHGLIENANFFAWLEAEGRGLIEGGAAARRHAVLTCCAIKAAIVAGDEREAGRRSLLNLGHTFAHAFEVESGYGGGLLHGEAVAVGLGLAFELSARLGYCPAADGQRLRSHLSEIGLPTKLEDIAVRSWTADALIGHMSADKKASGGVPAFVLARGIGQAFLCRDVDPREVRDLLVENLPW